MSVETIRLRGIVQGVGVRPTVARVARRLALEGWVRNDAEGVLVALAGSQAQRDAFVEQLVAELPPLARLSSVERRDDPAMVVDRGFTIVESEQGRPRTAVSPDAATCAECRAEVLDPLSRRYRYPFTNCTHCGPRFTIVTGVPYDRRRTTMAAFPRCAECQAEYDDESDRRYHAEPIACHRCGPRASLSRADGRASTWQPCSLLDDVDAVATLLERGEIVAIKALGGYHLCCDATHEGAVARLRERKRRPSKPFALMATDVAMIERFALISGLEREALTGPEAPIVLLDRRADGDVELAPGVAPGQRSLGFMLPSTPLHQIVLLRMRAPIVCTSGNRSEEPPCTEAGEARERLRGVADWYLDHDRPIAQRIDDSVARLSDGAVRVLRRARGYAPAPIALPPGFERAPRVLAMGAQWKGTVCLLQDGYAVLSQHLGDLDDLLTFTEWERTRAVLAQLYEHAPEVVAVDLHADYRSTQAGLAFAEERGLAVAGVQHHHAHVAACLAEHGVPRDTAPVLGITLDGLGLGDDGTLWGGEFLIAGYTSFTRVGTFKPVALLGGDLASEEPWRNLYAHLRAGMDWPEITCNFGDLELIHYLLSKPCSLLDQALASPALAPRASSCGRLFDAVAAAVGLHRERIDHEGQAASALEQAITPEALAEAIRGEIYPISVSRLGGEGLPCIEPLGMWRALLGDLIEGADRALIAARFHVALADAVVRLAIKVISARDDVSTVVLSGGVWQNRVLLELVAPRLRTAGLHVLVPRAVPMNDGGLALGEAVIAAARSLDEQQGTP
ncbi:MAG: carbamoyltransferase HypF [Byssovorax sp.]